jgi:hypothetical protein
MGFFLKFGASIYEVILTSRLNWTIQSQTKVCITRSSCVNKRETRAGLKVTDTISHSLSLSLGRYILLRGSS